MATTKKAKTPKKAAKKKKKKKTTTTKKKGGAKKAKIRRIVFFGTPEFAVPTLAALHEEGWVQAVVTQKARPAGRGKRLQEPPVGRWAKEHDIDVLQPERVGEPGFLEELHRLQPDVAVVVAFGQIFPAELLELPLHGCINLHASLLPKHRGAAPIQAAIMAGERKTGVTTMKMEEDLDTGPILCQEEVEIDNFETAGELADRLAQLGAEVMVRTLEDLQRGRLKPRPQNDDAATYAPRIRKQDGRVDWALTAEEVYNRLRAFTPWPGLITSLRGRRLRIRWGVPIDWEVAPVGAVGSFMGLRQGRIAVLCGEETVFGIDELQRPGKKPVRAADFVNGERLGVGERFV